MSPRIKLAVAAHIDDSSIFFILFFTLLAERACVLIAATSASSFSSSSFQYIYHPLPLSFFCHSNALFLFRLTLIPSFIIIVPFPFLSLRLLFFSRFCCSSFSSSPTFFPSSCFRHLRVIVSTCGLLFKGVWIIQLQMTSLAVVPWLYIHIKAHRMQQVTASSPP